MARSFPLEEGGAQPAFTSPMFARGRAVMAYYTARSSLSEFFLRFVSETTAEKLSYSKYARLTYVVKR
jgi:hypothetical protein